MGGGWESIWKTPGVTAGDDLGRSVAMVQDLDGDGQDDYLVGAYQADVGGRLDCGSALVLSGATGAVIRRHDGAASGDSFGEVVESAGDVDLDGYGDYMIGAPNSGAGGFTFGGSAYLYSGHGGVLLYRFDGLAYADQLGHALASCEDLNGDGVSDLLIGVKDASPSSISRAGSVLVYSGSTVTLLYQLDGTAVDDFFGSSVAGIGDVDGDGLGDFIVGAEGVDLAGYSDVGSAFVYSGDTGSLLYRLDGTDDLDNFGHAVTGLLSLDGDTIPDFAVGAPYSDAGGFRAGEVTIYHGATGAMIRSHAGAPGANYLGYSIASAGDMDGDGYGDLVVGVPLTLLFGYGPGSVRVYSGREGDLMIQLRGLDSSTSVAPWFGSDVAGGGDLNGDGVGDLVVGAESENPGGRLLAGRAYAFSGFQPYLTADVRRIRVGPGGVATFDIDFPLTDAGRLFRLLASGSGTGPSIYNGLEIPLTKGDAVWARMLAASPPGGFSAVSGTLDASGDASLTMTVPPHGPAGLIGKTFYFAAVSYDAPHHGYSASAAVPITFLP